MPFVTPMELGDVRSHHIHLKRMLALALRFFNLCLALFLLSLSSCFRTLLFHSFTLFASLFNHPFYVFLLQNLIIFFIFALSHRNHHFPNNKHPSLHATATSETPDPSPPPPTQTLRSQLVDQSPAVHALSQTPKVTRSRTTMSGNKASHNIDCYRRVRSENYSGRIVVSGSPELNGLNAVARYGGELGGRLCSVDKLSKEDFNRTVEEYIAKQRRMLWQEHSE